MSSVRFKTKYHNEWQNFTSSSSEFFATSQNPSSKSFKFSEFNSPKEVTGININASIEDLSRIAQFL